LRDREVLVKELVKLFKQGFKVFPEVTYFVESSFNVLLRDFHSFTQLLLEALQVKAL
jgi:hypothetical protein